MIGLLEIRAVFTEAFPTVDIEYICHHEMCLPPSYTVHLYGEDLRLEGNVYAYGDNLDAFVDDIKDAWDKLGGNVARSVESLPQPTRLSTEKKPFVKRLSCKHGHAFTKGNTYVDKRGSRQCKQCNVLRSQKFRNKTR